MRVGISFPATGPRTDSQDPGPGADAKDQDGRVATTGRGSGANGDPGPGQDPGFIRQCLLDLLAGRVEFPIKVEGTHTLPYASEMLSLDGDRGLLLKLIRPLPHELAAGALFEMVFSAGEQRYQGLITFQKREAYLTYRFTTPTVLTLCDRRRHKRYPFRPRERVDVLAQDSILPGHGLSGPLHNLSMGGLAFRVDRIVRLDNGLRIPATTAFFDRGRALPLLRVLNLPKVPLVEARGSICHAQEVDGQVLLGIEFGDLAAESGSLLRQVLEIRERSFRTTGGPAAPEPRPERARPAPAAAPEPPTDTPLAALVALRRRCRDLCLVGGPESAVGPLADRLREAGYRRIEILPSPEVLEGRPLDPAARPPALVFLLGPGSLAEVRAVQQALGAWGRLPALFLGEDPDPLAGLAEEEAWRLLPAQASAEWLDLLDRWAE